MSGIPALNRAKPTIPGTGTPTPVPVTHPTDHIPPPDPR
ncbi:hypothetical protein DFQ13_101119 [Actinokineospora spheciospongiae]|nr:hypothetical protein DFQ13_101119 [Actinokineospora spheciospongiae]